VTDPDNLRECYESLDEDKAVGVDGVTKQQYGENLEENLQELSERLKRMGDTDRNPSEGATYRSLVVTGVAHWGSVVLRTSWWNCR
jgi:hypothetical protein